MKTLTILLSIFCLAAVALADTPVGSATPAASAVSASLTASGALAPPLPSETTKQLFGSAEQELSKSTDALNHLRDQIANERLPLAQELTAQEDKLAALRRKHADLVRSVDTSNLGMSAIKGEIKARQDELSYVANLLDEYVRTFETKVNVCEMQYCREPIDAAKGAPTNNDLSQSEKLARQVGFVAFTGKRAFDLVGGLRFAGVGVDAQSRVVDGQFAMIGPVALFSDKTGATAGLALPQTGSDKPLIRSLEGPMQAGIATLVNTGEGTLPLDPSRGAALKALVQKTNLIHIFKKGGPVMWPLLIASILSIGTVLERVLFLLIERFRRNQRAMDNFFAAVAKGDTKGAIAIGKKTKFFVVKVLTYALEHKDVSLESALLYAGGNELKRFERGLSVLDTVITLAPLLGLLGTVTGMMGSFSLISGELGAPGEITGGIAEALTATAFGLGIAITSLIPFNTLNARVEHARHEIESASSQLELMVHPTAVSLVVAQQAQAATVAAGAQPAKKPAKEK